MGGSEAFDKLKLLSRQEFEVLKLYCQSWKYKEIAKELLLSESAVKNYIGRVYVRLGLDQLPERARTFTMGNVYCPVLNEFEMSTDIDKELVKVEKEPEPISGDLMKIIEDDDGGPPEIIEAELVKIEPTKEPDWPPQRKRRTNPFITGFIIISLISIVFMGYTIYNRFFGAPPSQPQNPPGEITTDVIADEDSKTTPTEMAQPAVMPANTAMPTEPPTPAPTSPPKPAILFEDNFDDGLSDAWEIVSGNPIVVNGMLSSDQDSWVLIGDPTWTNYSVEFDAESLANYWNQLGFNATAVRVVDMDNMYAYKWVDQESDWYVVENGSWNQIPQSDFRLGTETYNIRIVVKDDSITLYVDGMNESSFFSSKFPQGRIGLLIAQETLIDNFKVREILE